MNHFLRNSVIVTLQWPREPGAVYSSDVLPLTEMITTYTGTNHNSFVINLTISYNIFFFFVYNISCFLIIAKDTQ